MTPIPLSSSRNAFSVKKSRSFYGVSIELQERIASRVLSFQKAWQIITKLIRQNCLINLQICSSHPSEDNLVAFKMCADETINHVPLLRVEGDRRRSTGGFYPLPSTVPKSGFNFPPSSAYYRCPSAQALSIDIASRLRKSHVMELMAKNLSPDSIPSEKSLPL